MSLQGNKDFTLRIYRSDGTFIKTLNLFSWTGIKFQLNGGCGQFVFQLPNKFDDYGEGSTIYYNNRVELWSVDSDTQPLGTLVYSGWIDTFGSKITGQSQKVEVTCFGYVTFLSKALLTDGTNIVWQTNATSLAAGSAGNAAASPITAIAKKAIDLYRGYQSNSPINYNSTSMDSGITGSVTYTFDKPMIVDVLNTLVSLLSPGSYWYVGADNVVQIRLKPAAPVHTFIFNKHFNEVDVLNTADLVANNIVFETNNPNGTGLKNVSYYHDTASEAIFGKLWQIKVDNRYSVQADIDAVANAALTNEKSGKRKIIITLLDNSVAESYGLEGYPIEKIRPGDTCKVRGFNDITSQDFPDNMQIVGVERTPYTVKLELEQLQDSIARQVATALQAANNNSNSTKLGTLGSSQVNPTPGTSYARAIMGGNQSFTSTFATLIFDSVTTGQNVGGYYNPSTGIYTVPVSGWYSANAKYRINDGAPSGINHSLGIGTVNGDNSTNVWVTSSGTRNGASITRHMYLNAGDQLRAFAYWDSATAQNFSSGEFAVILISTI